jgi:hypothetical protein
MNEYRYMLLVGCVLRLISLFALPILPDATEQAAAPFHGTDLTLE